MQKYKAVISDIDGTILPIGPYHLPSERVVQAIIKLQNKGVAFTLATGRPAYMLKQFIKPLLITSPLIVDNGAVMIEGMTEKVIWERCLPVEEARGIIELIDKSFYMRVSCSTGVLENLRDIPHGSTIRKVSVHDLTHKNADGLINIIENTFKDIIVVKAASYKSSDLTDFYISHPEATKQHAVLHFAKLLGITTSEIIGIGDGYNDFSLLMACGLKVAMGNGVPELKAIADYIAPSVEDDGLVDVLEKYIFSS